MDYSFYMVWIAEGGFQKISNELKLYVGCTSTMTITDDPAFTLTSEIGIGHSGQTVYNIVPPTSDRSYCAITSHAIIDTKVLGTVVAGSAFKSSTCLSPTCTTVDIASTSSIVNVQFKV